MAITYGSTSLHYTSSYHVFEGYGATETAGSLASAVASDREGGHVGAPVPGLKVKLADIPSMGIVAERDNKGEVSQRLIAHSSFSTIPLFFIKFNHG
ncbi:unnamed protein product [Hydatigera taeniaeformis]|uniref:long-chain-fatty-acid--CoA ligase n=1 Tax=Hydatigena taeniaeformis TaxID=6205 RepID=A0A0R3XCK1_HYDTA|nr:unnamed protein product [Hydatigera taeniaeformis]